MWLLVAEDYRTGSGSDLAVSPSSTMRIKTVAFSETLKIVDAKTPG
jgi:hypothetical protein